MTDNKQQKSRVVISNQTGPHDRIAETAEKHKKSRFLRPIADHNKQAFDEFYKALTSSGRSLILDSCCGTGDSSRLFARQHPDHLVVGVDQSENRLNRERQAKDPENLLLVRADLQDFWRLMVDAEIQLAKHYLLYPNPYPKSVQFKYRWHAMPCFPALIKLGGAFELRSNWKTYLDEFSIALDVHGKESQISKIDTNSEIEYQYLTLFEKKYSNSGQDVWSLVSDL